MKKPMKNWHRKPNKNAITMTQVEDFIFSLLCTYQQRHVYLKCLENDWKNGCFGTGTAEKLLIDLLEHELRRLHDRQRE